MSYSDQLPISPKTRAPISELPSNISTMIQIFLKPKCFHINNKKGKMKNSKKNANYSLPLP